MEVDQKIRRKIYDLFHQVGKDYKDRGIAVYGNTLMPNHIEVIYHLNEFGLDPSSGRTVVVTAFPELSTEVLVNLDAFLTDHKILLEVGECGYGYRDKSKILIKEFPNFGIGILLPYNYRILERMLGLNIPELMPRTLSKRLYQEGRDFIQKCDPDLKEILEEEMILSLFSTENRK